MDNMLLIIGGILLLAFSISVFIVLIRNAIDGSNTAKKIDILTDEIRKLRTEIKLRDNKHIIDKQV